MLKIRVVDNGDHTAIAWFPDDAKRIAGCRGFAIERRLGGHTTFLANHVGFANGDVAPGQPWQWPIQRYLWWDYTVRPGDAVSYRVTPVVGPDKDTLQLATALASPWTPEQVMTSQDGAGLSAYFNRGIVATQWVAKELAAEASKQGPQASLRAAVSEPGNALRNALGGLLLPKLLSLLQNPPGPVFAALYELSDPEVIAAIQALGGRCSLILANGAFKPPDNDENAAVRADLRSRGVALFDRLVKKPHFAHNKFFVFCDAAGTPRRVWTGSTNCSVTGLCTQANNGLLIEDEAVAGSFMEQWTLLQRAGSLYPASLAAHNAAEQTFALDGTTSVTTWFAPTKAGEDMAQARALINAATQGILFLFFNPGAFQDAPSDETLLQTILRRHDPQAGGGDLYIHGVVNQEIAGLTTAGSDVADPMPSQPVALFNNGRDSPVRLTADVLVPAYIKQRFHDWEQEVRSLGIVMVHSKVVVLDPFGPAPVVMTGSHNMGMKASRVNDDNLVIIRGNARLAQAYAVNIIAIYQDYRWSKYVTDNVANPSGWHGLQDSDTWQDGHLSTDAPELAFWLGSTQPAVPALL